MNIRLASNTDALRWDTFVESHQSASPYHLWAWKKAIEDAYSHTGYYLLAEDNGTIIGILPMIHMRLPFLINQLVSLPFCDVGGCLAHTADTQALLFNEAMRIGRDLHANKIEIRTNSSNFLSKNQNVTSRASAANDKVSMFLDLPHEAETLWDSFKSKLRNQINRSTKNGLLFCWGSCDSIDQFYTVFGANMRDLGSPVHAKTWIQAILHHYGDAARMGMVFKDGTAIGCGIILMTLKYVSIPWASTLREYNNLSPNMLLYWNFLKYATDSGHTRFDFGRSTNGEGTYKFKAQWGAEPHKLFWHILHIGHQPTTIAGTPGELNINRERFARVWRKLPLWATNSLGPKLRRHLSL